MIDRLLNFIVNVTLAFLILIETAIDKTFGKSKVIIDFDKRKKRNG